MEIKRKVLVLFCLLLGGVVVADPLTFAASKNAKRANSKSKSKKKDSKKKDKKKSGGSAGASSSTAAAEAARAATAAAAAARVAASKTSTTTTVTDANVLADYYKACLAPICKDSSVDWARCYKESNFVAPWGQCKSTVANGVQADESVHAAAKGIVQRMLKNYFTESCENAGGYVENETNAICAWKICYKAKSADGKHESETMCKNLRLGNVVSCNYNSFGLGSLEYHDNEMNAEQKMAMLNGVVSLVTDGLNVAGQAISYVQTSKELKRKEHYVDDGWYTFDGKTLTLESENTCATYDYCGGTGCKEKQISEKGKTAEDGEKVIDKNGLIAWKDYTGKLGFKTVSAEPKTDIGKNQYTICMDSKPEDKSNGDSGKKFKQCSDMKSADWENAEKNKTVCYVNLKEKTELEKLEKANELARSTGYLDHLQGESDFAQQIIQYNNVGMGQSYAKLYGEGSSSSTGDLCNAPRYGFKRCPVVSGEAKNDKLTVSNIEDICFFTSGEKSVTINNGSVSEVYLCDGPAGGDFDCIKISTNGEVDESLVDCDVYKGGFFYHRNSQSKDKGNGSTIMDYKKADCMRKCATDSVAAASADCDCSGGNQNLKDVYAGLSINKELGEKVSNYNNAISSYQSNQNSVNESKKQVQDLKEAQNTALQGMIGTGTQSLMTNGVNMITTAMSAKQNTGTMNGYCYIGDPANGAQIFLTEGESKKLEWKLFN